MSTPSGMVAAPLAAVEAGQPPLSKQATTGAPGFALQNATPTILSWTAPSDGNLHRVQLFGVMHVTSAQTGGNVVLSYKAPDGATGNVTIWGGGFGGGVFQPNINAIVTVQAGSTVTLAQTVAQTAGAAVVFAELWGA